VVAMAMIVMVAMPEEEVEEVANDLERHYVHKQEQEPGKRSRRRRNRIRRSGVKKERQEKHGPKMKTTDVHEICCCCVL
jgi:hypothetical protein